MTAIRAFVVGIEAYDHPDFDTPGPATAALAVTDWLLKIGETTPLQLDLFLGQRKRLPDDERQALDQRLQAVHGRDGLTLHEQADWATLDAFVRKTLHKGCAAGTRLVVFWSGHGYTSNSSNDRCFFCGDYDEALPNRVFNASNFLRMLRTHAYSCFDNQIFFADVCGVYDTPAQETREAHKQLGTHQLAYFATPEGEYAHSFGAGGVFTQTAVNVLQGLGERWHEHDALSEALDTAFRGAHAKPFRIRGLRDQQELLESVVGRVQPAAGNPLFHSAHTLLSALDVPERVFRPHYLRTVSNLGIPAKAQGMVGVLQELSSLRDGGALQRVPYGLMQFLMRLAREPGLGDAIGHWLDDEAKAQHNSRHEIAQLLAEEDLQKILMIEVQLNTATREIAAFMPHLCHASGSFVQGESFEAQPVADWDDFVASLQRLFARFTVEGAFANLQIHFLVDTPLFDRPFLDIPMTPGGPPIGTETVVVLRHRQRMLSSDLALRRKWEAYADALRALAPTKLKWLPVAGNAALPAAEGLCYAEFSLPHPPAGAASCDREKQQLHKLLRLGTPCIYLPHAEPSNADWQTLRAKLRGLLKKLPRLDAVADKFHEERTRGHPHAVSASLLWDDPLSNPFIPTRGTDDP